MPGKSAELTLKLEVPRPSDEILVATLAGLFHDIGKVNGIGDHANTSATVYRDLLKELGGTGKTAHLLWGGVLKIIEHHHDRYCDDKELRVIFSAIKVADWLASDMREHEEENELRSQMQQNPTYEQKGSKWNLYYTFGLTSPFPYINEECTMEFSSLDSGEHRKINIVQGIENKLGKPLISPIKAVHRLPDLLQVIYEISFGYTDDTRDRDIPLPVHLHLVAAIAASLIGNKHFRYLAGEKCIVRKDDLSIFRGASQENALRVLVMDIHRIQKFISSVAEQGAIRNVAGRSLLVNMLNFLLPAVVAAIHGVTPVNVLVASGGRAILILPPKEINIEDLEKKINEALWDHNIELVVSIEKEDIKWKDLLSDSGLSSAGLLKALQNINEKLRASPRRVWLEAYLINKIDPYPASAEAQEICSKCGRPIRRGSNNICHACQTSDLLASFLRGKEVQSSTEIFSFGNGDNGAAYRLLLGEPAEQTDNFYYLFTMGLAIPVPAFYSKDPKDSHILSFEELAKGQRRENIIAVLRADGDSMGVILADLMKGKGSKKPFARYISFSKALSYFFERYVPKQVVSNFAGHMHLVYAGGDDLLAVGRLSELLEFLKTVHKEFENYKRRGVRRAAWSWSGTDKNYLPTFSAALYLFHIKYKFLWALEDSEELLDTAKDEAESEQCKYVKDGLVVHFEKVVGYTSRTGDYLNTATDILDLFTGGSSGTTAFYRVLQMVWRVIDERTPVGYSYLYHYFNRHGIVDNDLIKELRQKLLETLTKSDLYLARDLEFLMPWIVAYYKNLVSGLGGGKS